MRFEKTSITGVWIIHPRRHEDNRGYFAEVWREDLFEKVGITAHFVQQNVSRSIKPGTLRGLHFQLEPRAQAKLIAVNQGSIVDVAVDLRKSSATFGKHVKVELSASDGTLLFVPAGCAHGFCTLTPNTEVSYKVTDYWSSEHERGLLWCDPQLGIDWPFANDDVTITDRDRTYPCLADLSESFV